jgi:hypothetical protein
MRHARVTIVGTMGVVAVAALGLAAIHSPTRLWANGIFSLTLAVLFGATIAAFARAGRARTTWRGFAFAGWGYLVLSLGPWFEEATGPYLITTSLIDLAYARTDGRPSRILTADMAGGLNFIPVASEAFWGDVQLDRVNHVGGNRYGFVPSAPYPLYRIGHSLMAVVAGLAGGLFATLLTRQSPTSTDTPSHP